jgi:hypothetical protein
MHTTAVVSVKYWPGRQSLVGEFSAASYSSGPSRCFTFAGDMSKAFVFADIQIFK